MLGKMKQWLGIEGIKLELELSEKFSVDQGTLEGKVRMYSKNEQTVSGLRLVLIEKYTRGRDAAQLGDEYSSG